MKKIFLTLLATALLCSYLAISANMTFEDGVDFNDINFMYSVEKDLGSEPLTIEAVVRFNKRKTGNAYGGTVFGNYNVWDNNSKNFDIYIANGGHPVLRVRNFSNVYEYTFKEANVYTGNWVHLTVVRDFEKKEARCYINGILTDTVPTTTFFKPFSSVNYRIGTSNAYTNCDYLRGSLKSLAVYSDIRTDAEIKNDVNTLDKSELIVAYDFSDKSDRPEVVEDLSGNNNNALRNKMMYEEDIVDPSTYAYTFAIVGDTQSMAINFPNHFKDIYNYIYEHKDIMNIQAVIGLGDITETKEGDEKEWNTALDALKIIDDDIISMPIIGNHDNGYWYNQIVSKLNYANFATKFIDNDLRNTYYVTEICGIPYLFLQLAYGPSDDALAWANEVVAAHPDHHVIVSTHAYLTYDGTTLSSDDSHITNMANNGDQIWEKFVKKHKNIVLVLSGHIGWDYVVTTQRKGDNGNTVTEMLLDFQSTDNAAAKYSKISENGMGIVNMFHFSADGKTLTVETISTVNNKKFMEINQFTVNLDAPDGKMPEITKTEVRMTVDNMTAFVNGEAVTLDAAPVIKNDRTMLPVRFVAENLGATVGWDGATQTVTVKSDTVSIEIVIGSATAKVNGADITLDSPAYIDATNNRTYLPVRAVAENLGATVSWDAATRTAILVK